MQRTILITGCSSGIGYDAAHTLKARGWRVFATCRQEADCARLREEGLESFPLDYADEHAFLCAFIEALGLERFTIAGSSSGGLVAARYAAEHPERVERAILINFPLGHDRIRNGADQPLPPPDQPEAMMRALLERNLVDHSVATPALVTRLADFARREDPGGTAAAAWQQAASLTEAARKEMLARITAPTLVIWSAENRTLPVENGHAAFCRFEIAAQGELPINLGSEGPPRFQRELRAGRFNVDEQDRATCFRPQSMGERFRNKLCWDTIRDGRQGDHTIRPQRGEQW